MYIRIYICLYIYIYICTFEPQHDHTVCTGAHVRIYSCVNIYLYVYICIHIQICILNTYFHIYIHCAQEHMYGEALTAPRDPARPPPSELHTAFDACLVCLINIDHVL